MVPRSLVTRVYGFIAQLEDGLLPSNSKDTAKDVGFNEEWTPARIRRAVEESPPAMRDILQALADRPGEPLTTHQLAQAIQGNANADWKTVAGTLGAFSRRVSNRYGLESLPFKSTWDHAEGCSVHRMAPEMASSILQALQNGNRN
jgi:hypothetical protein